VSESATLAFVASFTNADDVDSKLASRNGRLSLADSAPHSPGSGNTSLPSTAAGPITSALCRPGFTDGGPMLT